MNKLAHPLDAVFGLESTLEENQYDLLEVPKHAPVAPEQPQVKDEDDIDVDKKIDEIYSTALDAYNNQTSMVEFIEPRYAARTAEVAATYLNIALQAVNSKARIKTDRKRSNQFIPYANGKSTTNVIVANREQVLSMIDIDGVKQEFQ